jgi:hypothetical protein
MESTRQHSWENILGLKQFGAIADFGHLVLFPAARCDWGACRAADARAFSSEVDTGSREENASKQESRASVLIQSEPIML